MINSIIPVSRRVLDKGKDYRKENFILNILIISSIIWLIFPFFITGKFDTSFLK